MGPEVRITPRSAYCRYFLRLPLGDDRLRLFSDGRVRVQLKRAWAPRNVLATREFHEGGASACTALTRRGIIKGRNE